MDEAMGGKKNWSSLQLELSKTTMGLMDSGLGVVGNSFGLTTVQTIISFQG